MAERRESDVDTALDSNVVSIQSLKLQDQSTRHDDVAPAVATGGLEVTCFSELIDEVTVHFQIIRFPKQSNTVSVTSILGGSSDNTGSGIARRLVLRSGLNIILACNIPKNSPIFEANAEKKLKEKLISLGCMRPQP